MTQDANAKAVVKAPRLVNRALIKRAAITIGALVVYHFAGFVPLPGLDADALAEFFRDSGANMPFQRMSVFMLGTMPMFSALIFAQVLMLAFPSLRQLQANPATRDGFERGVLAGALALAALQAWGMALALEGINGFVVEPGSAFRISCVVSMMAATGLIAWLASLISKYGLGSGFWLLFLTPALSSAASTGGVLMTAVNAGSEPLAGLLVPVAFIAAATFALVSLERTHSGSAATESFIWPVVLASAAPLWLLSPLMLFVGLDGMEDVTKMVMLGQPVRLLALAVLVPTFTLLHMHSLAEAGIQPAPIKTVISIAIVLAAIMITGELLMAGSGLQVMPDGQTLVILVSVALSVLVIMRPAATGNS